MNKGNIYVVTHKKYKLSELLKKKGYCLISVGKGKEVQNDGVCDDIGDNITVKNSNYCELTALYWIWKNDKGSNYKGICHYRRYLTHAISSFNESLMLGMDECINIFEKGNVDIILPEIQYSIKSVAEVYTHCGYKKDIDITRTVIEKKYPEYLKTFDKVFLGNKSYLTNIIIAPSSIFDSYCEWLFDILFEVERKVDLSGYTSEEGRIFGFLSERLLTVWVWKNNLKYIEFHPVNVEDRRTFKYYIEQIMIKGKIYQALKTMLYLIRLLIIKR